MKIQYTILIILLIVSCKHDQDKIVHYEYNGTKISRFDDDKKTFLYYGDCNNTNNIIKNASAIIDWRSDDFLFAFVLFHENGKIEVLPGGGGSVKINHADKMFVKDYQPKELGALMDSFAGEYDNLYQLSNNLELEKKRDETFGSKVNVKYEIQNDN